MGSIIYDWLNNVALTNHKFPIVGNWIFEHNYILQSPEIRKYKRKFNGEILCGALWGVNLLVGTDNGLLLLDRSGHGNGE